MFRTAILLMGFVLLATAARPASPGQPDPQHFRFIITGGTQADISNGTVSTAGISGRMPDGSQRTISFEQILMASVKRGTYAREGMALGIIAGTVVFVATSMDLHRGVRLTIKDDEIVPRMLLTAGSGAVVGLAVGVCISKWEDVNPGSLRPKQAAPSPGLSLSIRF